MDFPSYEELRRIFRDEALAHNSQLTAQILDRDGSNANAIANGSTAQADELIGQCLGIEARMFLDSARGDDLTRLVYDRYGLLRKPASPALGSVEFTTSAPNPTPFVIPAGVQLQTAAGKQFLTIASEVFPAGVTGPVYVAVRSVTAGLGEQVGAGQITNLISAVTGAPDDLRVTNSLATAGADDAERDESLRARAKSFWLTARKGTLEAIRQAVLAVPGVRSANVFEALDSLGRPAKYVSAIITDAFTASLVSTGTNPPTYAAQSQVLTQAVVTALDDTRPAGIQVSVQVAQVVLLGVQLSLRFNAGVDYDRVALRARAAVVNVVNALLPGQGVTPQNLVDALRAVPGLQVTGAEILSPAGEVVVQPLQVLRTSLSLVLANGVAPANALQSTANPDAAR